jgi:hypothetical protein
MKKRAPTVNEAHCKETVLRHPPTQGLRLRRAVGAQAGARGVAVYHFALLGALVLQLLLRCKTCNVLIRRRCRATMSNSLSLRRQHRHLRCET